MLALSLVALLLVDGLLLRRRARYRAETVRLRAGMSELEQKRADGIMAADVDKATLRLKLMRRQARGDVALHLAVNTDSGYVALDRGRARLRTMPARIGPERWVGSGANYGSRGHSPGGYAASSACSARPTRGRCPTGCGPTAACPPWPSMRRLGGPGLTRS